MAVSVIGSTVAGRYQIIGRVASGGMGEVYRAHDAVLGREVALKVLHARYAGDRGFVDRFRREARAAAILNHPSIVGVYDWGETDGTYFMVMEFVRGHNLRTLLSEYGKLEPAQVVEVASQVLAALDHAHGHGIVHRDVKPENILIAEDGTVKVADFGLARAFAEASISQAEGAVTGTVQYLAPEQITGEPADPRTDLYATGIVMFELLTGRPPYAGETSVAIAYKHLSDRVPAPSSAAPGVSSALDAVVLRATEKEREQRPASARSLRGDVLAAGLGLPPASRVGELALEVPAAELAPVEGSATVTIPRAVSRTARRRKRILRTAVVFAVIAALVAGAWATWTFAIPHYTLVPRDLAGLSVPDATRRLEALGLKVVPGQPQHSSSVDSGLLLTTRPPPGSKIRKGDQVTLIPSSGPKIVAVPRVVGLSEAEARQRLTADGFVVASSEDYSDQVAKGDVISQEPNQGQKVAEGNTVTIVVSKGPKPVKIPSLAGRTAADAQAELEGLGLSVSGTTEEFSTSVAQGDVIRTDPPAGATVHRGDSVALVVSKGPRTFPMPSVVGLARQAAIGQLTALGLHVVAHPVPGSSGNTIVSQLPSAGTVVQQGATVTLYYA